MQCLSLASRYEHRILYRNLSYILYCIVFYYFFPSHMMLPFKTPYCYFLNFGLLSTNSVGYAFGFNLLGTKIMRCVYKRMVQFQKLTRNLFLTLHRHNVHRQQRQLSKFLMRYQQSAFHAYCGAAGSVSKMAPQQEKAFCVLRFEVSRSVITVQREFRARFRKDAPSLCAPF